jgi:hypothetical protein
MDGTAMPMAVVKPRVVPLVAPIQTPALANLINAPQELVISEATFKDLAKARA